MITIKMNSAGKEVKIIQLIFGLPVTEKFTKIEEAEIKAYQKKKGLTIDGVVGPITWKALANDALTIRKGSKNNWVKAFQTYVGINVDGDFGPKTHDAARTFQSTNGLGVDGIIGKKSWAKVFDVATVVPSSGINIKPVDYKQYDSRWGKIVYTKNNTYNKKQTISNSGCGPTAAADIIATLFDRSVTPATLAALSVKNGYRTNNDGTAWGFFKFVAEKYGASRFVQTASYANAEAAIKVGAYVVVSVKKSIFTNGGHFICWWKTDNKYNYVNDPASASSTRAKNLHKHIRDAGKQYFIFYK